MRSTLFRPLATLLIATLCGLTLAAEGEPAIAADPAPQALDSNSQTGDQSIDTPTAWWVYNGQTPAMLTEVLSQNPGRRITELTFERMDGNQPRLAARMVPNSGSYVAPGGWWWYYGLTASDLESKLRANSARLIDITPYDIGGGTIRFAAVMVSNTGSAARSWTWLFGATPTAISAQVSQGRRLVDLDNYLVNGARRYTAVFVSNTGADQKSWQYWFNQSTDAVSAKVSAFTGRIVKLDRNPDGTYNFVQVKNTGSDQTHWWWYHGMSSIGDLVDHATQLAARPVSIVSFLNSSGQRRYSAAYIDNANDSTRRVSNLYNKTFSVAGGFKGIWAAHLKEVGGSTQVSLNNGRGVETASAAKVVHLLHAMRQVEFGNTTLGSAFVYYDYPDGLPQADKDKCPNPIYEVAANRRTDYNFEKGLDQMMAVSDNRTTRGVVLRYGLEAINNTAIAVADLQGTTLRHNMGCGYLNLATGKYEPDQMRNTTTAADLARVYETVWLGTALSETGNARSEFLESANPRQGSTSALQVIIDSEAAKLGKSSIAAAFGQQVRSWGKGGSYGTCLGDGGTGCGQKVSIRSEAGLIELPFKSGSSAAPRRYAYGHLISDVPVSCWGCTEEDTYVRAFGSYKPELFRDVIRAALQTW
jgi:hypothetical protein